LVSVCPCTLFLLSRENSERGRYHEIEGGCGGAARSNLAYLATIYKIAARGVLIRAVPDEEYRNQCLSSVVVQGFLERHFVRSISHKIEGGSDGAARSNLAYLAALYKIAALSVLIRAVPRSGASSLSPRCRFQRKHLPLRLSYAYNI
jgi:hypothetical protein